jgi:uncharacterized repeat protein (TIGR01451 family)/LPXTG-motif cell wall-anchored protein
MRMNMFLRVNRIIVSVFVLVAVLFGVVGKVYASDPIYGEGEVVNKSFRIEKHVRFFRESDTRWKDKVTGVRKGDVLEFRIKVTNTGELKTNDMEVKDILPSELKILDGDFTAEDLTRDFDNFKPGDVKEYKFRVQVRDSEFDRDEDFEKCVVNRAELRYKNKFEGSDVATVCYVKGEVTELPKTGAASTVTVTLAGLSLIFTGYLSKRKKA